MVIKIKFTPLYSHSPYILQNVSLKRVLKKLKLVNKFGNLNVYYIYGI